MNENDWGLEHQSQVLIEHYTWQIEAIKEISPNDTEAIDNILRIMHDEINKLQERFSKE